MHFLQAVFEGPFQVLVQIFQGSKFAQSSVIFHAKTRIPLPHPKKYCFHVNTVSQAFITDFQKPRVLEKATKLQTKELYSGFLFNISNPTDFPGRTRVLCTNLPEQAPIAVNREANTYLQTSAMQ